jgi:hypothetical protein
VGRAHAQTLEVTERSYRSAATTREVTNISSTQNRLATMAQSSGPERHENPTAGTEVTGPRTEELPRILPGDHERGHNIVEGLQDSDRESSASAEHEHQHQPQTHDSESAMILHHSAEEQHSQDPVHAVFNTVSQGFQ